MASTNGNGKKEEVPCVDYRRELRCYDSSRWRMYPKIFDFIFDPIEAKVMAFLIDKAASYEHINNRGGWFYCTVDDMEFYAGIASDTQLRTITRLRERGLLEVEKRGIPAKRWLRIITAVLNRLTEEAEASREPLITKRQLEHRRKIVGELRQEWEEGG